jgi:hypothetical protein
LVKKTISRAKRKLKKPKLTPHQLKVMKAATKAQLEGRSLRSAAQEIWPTQTPEAQSASMSRVLKSVNLNATWLEMMDERGLHPYPIIDAVRDGLKATKPMEMRYWVETEKADLDATVKPSRVLTKVKQVPDHSTRLNAARTAAQWMGVGKKQDAAADQLPGTIVVNQHFNTDGKAKKYVNND